MGNTSKKQPKNVAIGQRVRQYRKSKGFTLQQLAEIVYNLPENKGKERSPQHLGCIERGERELSLEWAMLLSIVFGVRKEYLLFQDDFETEQDKNISPIIKSFLDKKHRRDAVEACLKILGFTFEFIKIDILPKYTNMTNDEIFAMPKDEFSNVVKNIIEHERKYMLLDNEGNTIAVINDLTKERLTDEICDFIEFKICKMIGGSNEES